MEMMAVDPLRRVVVPRGSRASDATAGAECAGELLMTPLDAQRRRMP